MIPFIKLLAVAIIDLGSIACIGYGVYLIHEPSAFIVVGLIIWLEVNADVFARTAGNESDIRDDRERD
tara:strand:+ start:187 stop:390 length:204 start_codon:yes stop_codon:yes gene_type:complete